MKKIKSLSISLKNGWSTPPEGRYLTFREMACYGFSGLGVSFIADSAVFRKNAPEYENQIRQIQAVHNRDCTGHFTLCCARNLASSG